MSTSLLYHAFGIRGYDYVSTRYEGGAVIFKFALRLWNLCCCSCGSRQVRKRGQVGRRLRGLPIGGKPVWLETAAVRVHCPACGLVRQAKLGFAQAGVSYSNAFERYALDLCRYMSMLDVARHLKVGWDLIKDIQKKNLIKKFSHVRLKDMRLIAIDEISMGKGHRYLTIVLDLESGAVVFVGEGKGGEALLPFWKSLKHSGADIQAVATDMSPAYIAAVSQNLPRATLVFDHFHVIKLFNDKLSDFRRTLYRKANALDKQVIKGTRWLLLKNPENLDPDRDEPARLKRALEMNQPLAAAYYMKENLRQLWSQPDRSKAESFLFTWVLQAWSSGISMLKKFADTLMAHRAGILAYYLFPISTGPLEGVNNKIKTMKRQAYGFRDLEFFKLKIKALHQAKYALIG